MPMSLRHRFAYAHADAPGAPIFSDALCTTRYFAHVTHNQETTTERRYVSEIFGGTFAWGGSPVELGEATGRYLTGRNEPLY